jgi:Xaa-Pro aminopeptidase
MNSRLARLRNEMRRRGLDAVLVTFLPNVRYLSGFSGSHGLCVVTRNEAVLVTDSRYARQSRMEAKRWRCIVSTLPLLDAIEAEGVLRRHRRVGFEADHLSYAQYRSMKRLFPRLSFTGSSDLVEDIALVKDASEVENIRKAARISDRVFGEILSVIRPGVRESEVAAEISYLLKSHGGEQDAFEPIVASGERAILPHARATTKRIRRGDMVILDFGTTCKGYCSDITRTVAVGRASRRAREVYALVLDAHGAAVAAAKAGLMARELDAVARDRFRRAGFGKYFVHSLGHGLGLSVHERPRISPLGKEQLQDGSVVTIEPGLYVPGVGGVRIEDDVVLDRTGCRVLTAAPRELMTL